MSRLEVGEVDPQQGQAPHEGLGVVGGHLGPIGPSKAAQGPRTLRFREQVPVEPPGLAASSALPRLRVPPAMSVLTSAKARPRQGRAPFPPLPGTGSSARAVRLPRPFVQTVERAHRH